MDQRETTIEDAVRTLRLILGALIAGLVLFVGIAWVTDVTENAARGLEVLPYVTPVLAVADLVGYLVLRRVMLDRLRSRLKQQGASDESPLELMPRELFTLTMVGAALAESVGLFGTVVFLVTRLDWVLVAPAVAVGVILLLMPSAERFRDQLTSLSRESY